MMASAAMFLCLFFLLSTAVAKNVCLDEELILLFFDRVDVNNDYKITRSESNKFFKQFDINYDNIITFDEVKQRVAVVALELEERASELLNFLDANQDGVETSDDIDILLELIDTDGDGAKSMDEYISYVKKTCEPQEPTTTETPYG